MSQILPFQHLIRTGALSKELGVSTATLCNWTTEDSERGQLWRSCMLRRGWYVVPKLRAAGLLAKPEPAPQPAKTAQDSSLRDDLIQLAALCLTVARKLKEEMGKR